MYFEIKESWHGNQCALCALFGANDCTGCPLHDTDQNCNESGSPWCHVAYRPRWGEWAEAAKKMLDALIKLKDMHNAGDL